MIITKQKSAHVLVGFLLASFSAAAIGAYATGESVRTWYPLLNKPTWNPPSWLFGPVWTVLYIMMSVAAWRIWKLRDQPGVKFVLGLFFGQLVLNALWSILFFGLHSPGWALIEISILWSSLALLQRALWRLDRLAGWLWAPYLTWVSFATFLNGTIWWLNR
ncbi:MAG: sensory protein TspO [Opitutaceae bacterium]|nr:sensory protein TspO [Opitutaceae bacterium]|tara:strand:- start:2689 stop:3174 length:486 start_codon:yes stop_codon:yes gene_type:complete